MARGFVYLAAVADWYSRRSLAWRVSMMLDTAFCVEAVEEAVQKAYDTVSHARQSLATYTDFYNTRRPHSSLDRQPPDQVHFNQPLPLPKAA